MSRPTQRSEHNRHDRLLVARFAANDSYRGEVDQASELIASCAECARLADDMRLLSIATAQLPAARRRRDFRLTREQAEALHGSVLDRFLRRLAGSSVTALRPVAGVALSIGLALAVIGSGLPLPYAVTPASQLQQADPPPEHGEAPGAPADDGHGRSAEATEGGGYGAGAPLTTKDTSVRVTTGTPEAASVDDEESPINQPLEQPATDFVRLALIYGGVTMAALSFGLLLLAWFARRREDPLLR